VCVYKNSQKRRRIGNVVCRYTRNAFDRLLCVSYLRVCVSAHATKHDEVSVGSSGAAAF
jgi:hypothetical protein